MNKGKDEKLLDSIENQVDRIDKLIQRARPTPLQELSPNAGAKKYWQEARAQSRKLFEMLKSRWNCDCKELHRASLQLTAGTECGLKFELFFSFDASEMSPWNWRNIVVEPMKTLPSK